MARVSIFVDDSGDECPPEFLWVEEWLARWGSEVQVVNYSSGGWEHCWDVEGPSHALSEVPREIRCYSDWANSDLAP